MARHGGREKGTLNKRTEEQIAKVEATGQTPLDFLLSVMRDEDRPMEVRIDAAKSAAPYVHPKLSAVATLNAGESDFSLRWKDASDEDLEAEIARLDMAIYGSTARERLTRDALASAAKSDPIDITPVEPPAPAVVSRPEPEPVPMPEPEPEVIERGYIRWRRATPADSTPAMPQPWRLDDDDRY